jgi:hypothetical protein
MSTVTLTPAQIHALAEWMDEDLGAPVRVGGEGLEPGIVVVRQDRREPDTPWRTRRAAVDDDGHLWEASA